MTIMKFKKIILWQNVKDLAINIYFLNSDCNDFRFKNQNQLTSVFIIKIAKWLKEKVIQLFPLFLSAK